MDKRTNLADLERENERLRRQLAELDELPSKNNHTGGGVSRPRGAQDIATNISKKIKSVPPRQGDHGYLDLYLLQKERDRLVKETASIKKRRLHLGMKVSQIDEEMAEKQEEALQDMKILSAEHHVKPVNEKASGEKQEAPERHEHKKEEWNTLTLEY